MIKILSEILSVPNTLFTPAPLILPIVKAKVSHYNNCCVHKIIKTTLSTGYNVCIINGY